MPPQWGMLAIGAFEDRLRVGADEPFTRYYVAAAWALSGDRYLAYAIGLAAQEVHTHVNDAIVAELLALPADEE